MKTGEFALKIVLAVVIVLTLVHNGFTLDKLAAAESVTKKTQAMGKEDWKAEWELTLRKAREEREVAISGTTIAAGLKNSVRLFKEKFGIDILVTTDRTAAIAPKVLAERRNGLYLQDVLISGQATPLTSLKPVGALEPLDPFLILPEVLDRKLWYEGQLDWADEGHYNLIFTLFPIPMVFINTDLVKPEEIRSYYDLLNPKWEGKILINDPTTAGIGNSSFNAMLYNSFVDQDFFRKLAAQKNPMTRDQDLQANWLARGKYPVALWPNTGALAKFMQAGAPVMPISDMKEGVAAGSAGSGLSVFSKAPHPNATKVFINWFLSREGQLINQKTVRKQTRRIDVAHEGVSLFETRRNGVKYFPMPDEKETFILTKLEEYKKLADKLFAPLK